MEEELLARETADIWENIEDMMEEEFEDCAKVDPEPEVEEARFEQKLDEKNLQLERIKRRLEEATKTLENLKRFKNNDDDDSDEGELIEKEKQGK